MKEYRCTICGVDTQGRPNAFAKGWWYCTEHMFLAPLDCGHPNRGVEDHDCAPFERDKALTSAYYVIAHQQAQLEALQRDVRQVKRQLELFQRDGNNTCITVSLAILDGHT